MQVRCMEIPGIGRKYTLKTAQGSQLIIIFYRDGRREFYFASDPMDEPSLGLNIKDEEARVIGALLLGVDYHAEPEEEQEARELHDNILVEWYELAKNSVLVNRTIAESQVRAVTGVTIIGIERDGEMIGSPEVDEKLLPGDKLMITGTEKDIKNFEHISGGEKR